LLPSPSEARRPQHQKYVENLVGELDLVGTSEGVKDGRLDLVGSCDTACDGILDLLGKCVGKLDGSVDIDGF